MPRLWVMTCSARRWVSLGRARPDVAVREKRGDGERAVPAVHADRLEETRPAWRRCPRRGAVPDWLAGRRARPRQAFQHRPSDHVHAIGGRKRTGAETVVNRVSAAMSLDAGARAQARTEPQPWVQRLAGARSHGPGRPGRSAGAGAGALPRRASSSGPGAGEARHTSWGNTHSTSRCPRPHALDHVPGEQQERRQGRPSPPRPRSRHCAAVRLSSDVTPAARACRTTQPATCGGKVIAPARGHWRICVLQLDPELGRQAPGSRCWTGLAAGTVPRRTLEHPGSPAARHRVSRALQNRVRAVICRPRAKRQLGTRRRAAS